MYFVGLDERLLAYQPTQYPGPESGLLLSMPIARETTHGDKCFRGATGTFWNNLTPNIKNYKTLDTFKKQVKTTSFHFSLFQFNKQYI